MALIWSYTILKKVLVDHIGHSFIENAMNKKGAIVLQKEIKKAGGSRKKWIFLTAHNLHTQYLTWTSLIQSALIRRVIASSLEQETGIACYITNNNSQHYMYENGTNAIIPVIANKYCNWVRLRRPSPNYTSTCSVRTFFPRFIIALNSR